MKPETVEKGASIISYGLLMMTFSHILTHAFAQIHTALFPILRLPEEFNLSYQQMGLIAAIPPLCQTFLSIPMGLLSDRVGSKKMVAVSMVVASLGSILAYRAQSPLMLIFAVSVLYINTTIYHPAAYSFTSRLFTPRDRPKALGLHGAGGTLGNAIGPISVSILMGFLAFKWRQVYLFWLFPVIIGIIAVLLIRNEPREDVLLQTPETRTEPKTTSIFSISLFMFLIFSGIRMMARGMIQSFLSVYLVNKGLDLSLSSLVLGSDFLMGVVASPLGGFITGRFGEKKWLLIVQAISYTCFGVSLMIPGTLAFMILYIAYGFFYFLSMASNSAIMAILTPSEQRGLGYALFFLPGSIMGAVAPLVAAYIAEVFGLFNNFIVALVLFISGLVVLKLGVKVG